MYATYVLVEDYLENKFDQSGTYSEYEGSIYNKLFTRQRQLPFGGSLQNHALNNRMNAEFKKYFPTSDIIPILRKLDTNRYWINENLLKTKVGKTDYNLASVIIEIIDEYTKTKQDAFQRFIKSCEVLQEIEASKPEEVIKFISGLIAPNVDARLFEIVSYSILKYFYHDQNIFWGFKIDNLTKENLKLYKTGRTNANDGGIDFVYEATWKIFSSNRNFRF